MIRRRNPQWVLPVSPPDSQNWGLKPVKKHLKLVNTLNISLLYFVTFSHATLLYVTLRRFTLRSVTLRYITLRYITLRCVTLRCVTLRLCCVHSISITVTRNHRRQKLQMNWRRFCFFKVFYIKDFIFCEYIYWFVLVFSSNVCDFILNFFH